MARKVKTTVYSSWDEVDEALKELGEIRNDIIKAETELNEKKKEATALHKKITTPLIATEKLLTAQIEQYAAANRDAVEGQTMKLNFGKITFRRSSRLSYPTAKVQEIIGRILLKGYHACIRIKEELDKEALEKLTDTQLEDIGITRVREEKLTIEPDLGRLKNAL